LLTALFLLAGLIWTALDLRRLARTGEDHPARLTPLATVAALLLTSQLLFGAWVAGLDAGQVSNSWPLMNDRFVPEGIDTSRGAAFAFTHDPYLIHFVHRWWAWVVVIGMVVLARRVNPIERRASIAIHAALGTQILLGIATVLSGVALPLAVLHQAVGALLVAATAWGMHVIGRRPRERRHRLCLFANADEAMRIGRTVVEERLAACINVLAPCTSIYWWDGAVAQSDEVPALLKTTLAGADALVERIASLHSYEVPAIVVWPVDRLAASFGDWVENEVR
jgi:uncharacterized protein involved in tolerance to divalent cations